MTTRIRFREVDTSVRVVDSAGDARPNVRLRVEQIRHAFGFGSTAGDLDQAPPREQELFLDLFDSATLPFYWGRYEPVRGQTAGETMVRRARWFTDRGVRLKGHPLVWHYVKAAWLDALSLPDVEGALRDRIRREVRDFAGLVQAWDVLNEGVIMPHFTNEPDGVPNAITRLAARLGRVEMVRLAVEEARSIGTSPTLVLNDFNLGPEYARFISEVLDAGIAIDAIGLQSHMHQGFRGEEELWEVCERFARFGLPLHWTETTLVSGDLMPREIVDLNDYVVSEWPSTPEGEARQADEIVRHYSTLTSHPAVESITYWGWLDGQQWLGAPAGLVRADGTTKPSYRALRDLVRGSWWYEPRVLETDIEGNMRVAGGWAGRYRLTEIGADGQSAGPGVEIDLEVGKQHRLVRLWSPDEAGQVLITRPG